MSSKADLIQYMHRFTFIPVVITWTQAIDAGYFSTWPGLTSDLVRKHLPKSLANAKSHLKIRFDKITGLLNPKPHQRPSPHP